MFRNFKRLSFLMIAISLTLQANPLSAQLFCGHWYHDPVYPAISSLPATRDMTSSGTTAISGMAANCPTVVEETVGLTSLLVLDSSTSPSRATSAAGVIVVNPVGRSRHAEPRNAILKLWVPDGLHVKINGKSTKPQSLAGKHRNSRVFSLTGLKSDEFGACDIIVCEYHGKHVAKYNHVHSVVAGGSYDVRFPRDFEPTPGSSKPLHIGPHPPAHGHAQDHHRSFSIDSHDHKARPGKKSSRSSTMPSSSSRM